MSAEVEMTPQVAMWRSEFGNDYTSRNSGSDFDARIELWKQILPRDCESVLEVGANTGTNLKAIATRHGCELFACEPNDLARGKLLADGILTPENVRADTADNISFPSGIADLVFTSGVLIHIPSNKLLASMEEIHRCARRWIICAEYFAPKEEMIPYRGYKDAMWRRDYGSIWLDHFSDLRCISVEFAWKRLTGLDNLMIWVFEKQGAE